MVFSGKSGGPMPVRIEIVQSQITPLDQWFLLLIPVLIFCFVAVKAYYEAKTKDLLPSVELTRLLFRERFLSRSIVVAAGVLFVRILYIC